MPFTLFHLGPAFAFGLPLRKYLHAPTFIVGNVILDVEPLLVLVLGLRYPLHGFLHTFLLALVVGLLLGFVMFKLKGAMSPVYRKIKLEPDNPVKLRSFLLAGVFGAMLHVLLDALLYSEMEPFFPWTVNPLIGVPITTSGVYTLCVYLWVFGIICYVALLGYSLYKKTSKPPK